MFSIKLHISLIFCLALCQSCFTQKLYEKVIYSIPEEFESDEINYDNLIVDTAGNLCLEVRKDKEYYFFNRESLFGPFDFISGIDGGNDNYISYSGETRNDVAGNFWYRNNLSTTVYGPVFGKLKESVTSIYGNGVTLLIERNDSLIFYVNNRIICGFEKSKVKNPFGRNWCMFNERGDFLLNASSIDKDFLYLNGELIDSAEFLNGLGIDNSGNYVYTKGYTDYRSESVFSIYYNQSYLYSGRVHCWGKIDKSGRFYFETININGQELVFKDRVLSYPDCVDENGRIDERTIIYPSFQSYIKCCSKDNRKFWVICNGVEGEIYDNVYSECMDSLGNYAFFGLKDYYLYPVINGIRKEPLSKFGLRAKPIYISPKGDYFVYYGTKDSIYFFHNEELFRKIGSRENFKIDDLHYRLRDYDASDEIEKTAKYLEIKGECYFIIRDFLYGPYSAVYPSYSDRDGAVKEAKIYDDGSFFMIQKSLKNDFTLVYNNDIFEPIQNVDGIVENSFFRDNRGFTFFATRGNTIYQYSTYER